MSEVGTVVWKEWREHFLRKGRPSRTVVATLVLVYEFFWPLVVATVLVVGLYVLWDNLRELRSR